tara:strand:- start:103 stop:459 length:357 start_codon:yes stop_codon:yes gene_type:complete
MPTATLTFTLPIQTSVQTGDLILYCNPATVGTFSTAAQSDVILFGTCLTVAAGRLTMTVDHDASTVPPTASSFILFSKDKYSNPSGLLGYYAEVCFKNTSTAEAELFGINADVFESSK